MSKTSRAWVVVAPPGVDVNDAKLHAVLQLLPGDAGVIVLPYNDWRDRTPTLLEKGLLSHSEISRLAKKIWINDD